MYEGKIHKFWNQQQIYKVEVAMWWTEDIKLSYNLWEWNVNNTVDMASAMSGWGLHSWTRRSRGKLNSSAKRTLCKVKVRDGVWETQIVRDPTDYRVNFPRGNFLRMIKKGSLLSVRWFLPLCRPVTCNSWAFQIRWIPTGLRGLWLCMTKLVCSYFFPGENLSFSGHSAQITKRE